MIKFHNLSLLNKAYSEDWLNKMSDRGYSLEKVKWWLFVFRKRADNEEKERYQLEVFPKAGIFSSMSADDVVKSDDASRAIGLERVASVAQVAIYRVLGKQKDQHLYSAQQEKSIIKKTLKVINLTTMVPMGLILFSMALNAIDNFNNWRTSDVVMLAMQLCLVALLLTQYLNMREFNKINKAIFNSATDRLVYLNSRARYRLEIVIGGVGLILALTVFSITFLEMKTVDRFMPFLIVLAVAILVPVLWNVFLIKKIKPNPNITETTKKRIFFGGLIGVTVITVAIVHLIIDYFY